MMKLDFFVVIGLLFLLGCSSKKQLINLENIPIENLTKKQVIQRVKDNDISFEWFSAKANTVFSDNYEKMQAQTYIRIKKDSIIWIAVKKMGIEGARMLINKDSVYILNRLDKQLIIGPIEVFAQKTGLYIEDNKSIFSAIQNIILGNLVFFDKGKHLENKINAYEFKGNRKGANSRYSFDSTLLIKNIQLIDVTNSRLFEQGFKNYQFDQNKKKFAWERVLKTENEEGYFISLKVAFKSVEFDIPKKTPFVISNRYEHKILE